MPAKRYRQFARQALVKTTSSTTAPPATQTHVADAFRTLRERLKRTLVPVFGPVAVEALFERSVHLVDDEFHWLAASMSSSGDKVPDVSRIPGGATVDNVLDALTAVIAYDIGLLVEFVGEDLIMPLVHKAWGPIGRLPTRGESD